jgi:hypothetical protein
MTRGQLTLETGIARNLLRMAPQVLAECERGVGVVRRPNVHVMGSARPERGHALDEEHPVAAGVIGPEDVFEPLQGTDEARPARRVGGDQHDVDVRLGRNSRDRGPAEVYEAERADIDPGKGGPEPAGLPLEHRGPARVVVDELDAVLRGVAEAVAIVGDGRHGRVSISSRRLPKGSLTYTRT